MTSDQCDEGGNEVVKMAVLDAGTLSADAACSLLRTNEARPGHCDPKPEIERGFTRSFSDLETCSLDVCPACKEQNVLGYPRVFGLPTAEALGTATTISGSIICLITVVRWCTYGSKATLTERRSYCAVNASKNDW